MPDYPQYMGGAFLRVKNYGGLILKNNYCHSNMLCFDFGVAYNYGGFLFCMDVDTIEEFNP